MLKPITLLVSFSLLACATDPATTDIAEQRNDTTPPPPPPANSCKAGDRSRTTDPQTTCTYTVNGSDGTKARISTSRAVDEPASWRAECYLENVDCSSAGQKTELTCTLPEYPATGQEVTTCKPQVRNRATWVLLGSVHFETHPTNAEIMAACRTTFKATLDDLPAAANRACNERATAWTTRSRKAPICCKPAAPATPTTPTTPTTPPTPFSDELDDLEAVDAEPADDGCIEDMPSTEPIECFGDDCVVP